MGSYATFQIDASQAPPWLLGPLGAAWLSAFGATKDSIVDRAKQSVKARFAGIAPSDALSTMGGERGILRGPTEGEASYRARIQNAWNSWGYAGTAWGLLYAFWIAGCPNVQIQTQGSAMRFQLVANPTGNPQTDLLANYLPTPVHLGGSPSELASDIAVFILAPFPTWWSGTIPADGSADQRFASALVAQLKPAHCRCVKLNVVNGPAWNVGGITWNGFTWGGGTNVAWTPPSG